MDRKGLVIAYMLQYSMACSLVFFKVALVLVNIRFICHVHEARDLRETRIYTINTALEKTTIIHQPTPHTYYNTVILMHVD